MVDLGIILALGERALAVFMNSDARTNDCRFEKSEHGDADDEASSCARAGAEETVSPGAPGPPTASKRAANR